MADGGMGGSLSRRSQRLAGRRQAEADAEEEERAQHSGALEESDSDYSDEEYGFDEEVYAATDSYSDDEVEQRGGGTQSFLAYIAMHGQDSRLRESSIAHRFQQLGPTPKNRPLMVNDLSQELDRASAAESEAHPICPESSRRWQAKNCAGAKITNTAALLWSRQANLACCSRGWGFAQRRHLSGLHFAPNKPLVLRDRMHSRAYIGQYSGCGDLFVGAFQADKRVRVYDTDRDWRLVKDVHARNLRWTITDTTLSVDQSMLLYATINPVVHLVNVGVGGVDSEANVTEIHEALHFDEFEGQPEGYRGHFGIFSIQWSSNGREIVAGTGHHRILVFDAERGKTVTEIKGHKNDVNAVAFLDDSPNLIISGSDDSLVKVWDRRNLSRQSKACGVLVGHTQGVTHVDAKGDGRYLLSNGKDQAAKVWDVRKMLSQTNYASLPVPNLPRFEWDYRCMDYPLRDLDVRHPQDCSVQNLRGHFVTTTLIRAYWSPLHTTGQRFVYSASADGCVYIYDVVTSKLLDKLSYYKGGSQAREILRDVSWHPYQDRLVTAGFDGALVEWGYSAEPLGAHLDTLPDTGYDAVDENW